MQPSPFLDFCRLRASPPAASFKTAIAEDYGHIPAYFVENRGQFGARALYVARSPELTGYFGSTEVVMAARSGKFRLTFPDADPALAVEGVNPTGARFNFMTGPPAEWKLNLPSWNAVAYRGIFPGIDLLYTASRDAFKSQFIVAPGADPAAVRLRYDGASVHLDRGGALIMPSNEGEFRENAPVLYQEIDGRRIPVEGSFRMERDGTVGFLVGDYDHARPLVIDPVLTYSTFLGGSSMGCCYLPSAVDGMGNAYVAGWTTSINLPTVNSIHAQQSGGVDAFVAKLGPGGNSLVYSTYLGGRGDDRAFAVATSIRRAAPTSPAGLVLPPFPPSPPAQSTLAVRQGPPSSPN